MARVLEVTSISLQAVRGLTGFAIVCLDPEPGQGKGGNTNKQRQMQDPFPFDFAQGQDDDLKQREGGTATLILF